MHDMSSSTPTFTEQARRAQLLRAAIDTVNEVGYPKASLAAIARTAGVAKSATVYYFESKDALLLAVVERVFTALERQLVEAVERFATPSEQLLAYLEAYLDFADAHRADIVAGIEIVVTHRGADGVPMYLADTGQEAALLGDILRAGIRRGQFRTMSIGIAVALVEAVLDVATTALQRDLSADLIELRREIIEVVFRGIAPDSSPARN
ncbi:MAG: TetR/AcrR family transcriptional regulator [Cumulibacter sp.]